MKLQKLSSMMFTFLMLPLTLNGMLSLIGKKKITFKKINYCNHDDGILLHKKISSPHFDNSLIYATIEQMRKHHCCSNNCFVEKIVHEATHYKNEEKKYANLIKKICDCGWEPGCCTATVLHTAVISDLPYVTQELLDYNKAWVKEPSLDGSIPLHYAQSRKITKLLLDSGSNVDAKDKLGNTPLHMAPGEIVPLLLEHGADIWVKNNLYLRIPGNDWKDLAPSYDTVDRSDIPTSWHRITPLHKAVDQGDLEKCKELLKTFDSKDIDFVAYEKMARVLLSLANLRYWRTNDSIFLACHKAIVSSLKQKEKRLYYEEMKRLYYGENVS